VCLYSWITETRELQQPDVNIGGKTIRGSGRRGEDPVYAVSVRVGDGQIVLGLAAVDEESNEITAVPKLLPQ
jgi:hypothetical protein